MSWGAVCQNEFRAERRVVSPSWSSRTIYPLHLRFWQRLPKASYLSLMKDYTAFSKRPIINLTSADTFFLAHAHTHRCKIFLSLVSWSSREQCAQAQTQLRCEQRASWPAWRSYARESRFSLSRTQSFWRETARFRVSNYFDLTKTGSKERKKESVIYRRQTDEEKEDEVRSWCQCF